MAKKKTEDAAPVEEGLDVIAGENTEANADGGEATPTQSEDIPEAPVEKKKRASKKTSEGDATAQSEDIPDDVKAVLKCFPGEEELYVSKYGGTFPKDSEPFVRGNAILYKNPFYKS